MSDVQDREKPRGRGGGWAHITSLQPAAAPATPDSGIQAERGWHWASGSLPSWPTGSSSPCSERDRKSSWSHSTSEPSYAHSTCLLGSIPKTPYSPTHLSLQGDFVTLQVLSSRPLLHKLCPQLVHLVGTGDRSQLWGGLTMNQPGELHEAQ